MAIPKGAPVAAAEPAEADFPPAPAVEMVPAADIQAPTTATGVTSTQVLPVVIPRADAEDKLVRLRAKDLKRLRQRAAKLAGTTFPWFEVFLAISTLLLGAFVGSASTTQISIGPIDLDRWWFLVVGVAAGVAYIFSRSRHSADASSLGREVLEEIPDPDETVPEEVKP